MRTVKIDSYVFSAEVCTYKVKFLGWPIWLTKIARKLQEWLNAHIPTDTTVITRHVVDLSKIDDAILKTIDEFWKTRHTEPTYILIGIEQLKCLQLQLQPWEVYSVHKDYYRRMELFGVEVILVPWMDGILALPDIESLRKY